MGEYVKFINGKVITSHRVLSDNCVVVKDGKIIYIGDDEGFSNSNLQVIDVGGKFISPGFIDIHVHGGGGYDFMDGTLSCFHKVAKAHAKFGTTAMYPTTLTSEVDGLFDTLVLFEEACRTNSKGAKLMGMHLEGPYFAMNQRGAQDPKYIRHPDPTEYKRIVERFGKSISRWSAAPELPGAIDFAKYLRDQGILVALAHTDAVYEEVLPAVEAGYSLATHLYSGMSGVTRKNAYRYAGVIESSLLIDEIDVEIIADGTHLPEPFLKLIYKIKGADRIALITDAMRGAGMPEGKSILGNIDTGLEVIIEDGVAKLPDRSAFAGSVATANLLVKNMIELSDVPIVEAIRMASLTPARIMGIDRQKGSIAMGKDADIIVINEKMEISLTMVEGNIVYQSAN